MLSSHLARTSKVVLALFLAVFSTNIVPVASAYAMSDDKSDTTTAQSVAPENSTENTTQSTDAYELTQKTSPKNELKTCLPSDLTASNSSKNNYQPCYPPQQPSCVDGSQGHFSNAFSYEWINNHQIKVTKKSVTLCAAVTLYFSSYSMPNSWDGGGFNASAAPQTKYGNSDSHTFDTTSAQGEVATLTVTLPGPCVNTQVDLYYAPEINTVNYPQGHGAQYITHKFIKRQACTIAPCPAITGPTLVTAANQFADYNGFGIIGGQDTRSKGHYEFTADALKIYTDDNSSQAKVAWYHGVNYPLSQVGAPTLDYTADMTKPFTSEPGKQLVIDFDNNGTPDGILVGEPTYGNNWWLTGGSAQFVKDGAPHTGGGNGSNWFGSLDEWYAAFPNAQVKAVGFSLGSGVYAAGMLKSLTFGCHKWVFQAPKVTPEPPIVRDFCYNDIDQIQIPSVTGVKYHVNGDSTDHSGTSYLYTGGTVTITAVAKPGYALQPGSVTSWSFNEDNFTNEQCVTITKKGVSTSDTNQDGVISVGDLVTWTITLTNNGTQYVDTFDLTVIDAGATFQGSHIIKDLAPGQSVTVTVTKPLTVSELQACQANNTASFTVDNLNYANWNNSLSLFTSLVQKNKLVVGGSASATFDFTCPTPGRGHVSSEAVMTLPATGPASTHSNPLLIVAAAVLAYGATFYLQNRRLTKESR